MEKAIEMVLGPIGSSSAAAALAAAPLAARAQVAIGVAGLCGVAVAATRSAAPGLPRALLCAPFMLMVACTPFLFNFGDELMARVVTVLV